MITSRFQRVLVTGAAGFIGRHVVRALLAENTEITVLQGPGDTVQECWSHCARIVKGDICDPSIQADALIGVQSVCHLAAYIPKTFADHTDTLRCHMVNADATLNLALRATAAGVRHFIFASAGNMYAPNTRPCREEDTVFPIGPASGYLASKLTAELYLKDVMRRTAMNVTLLRIGTPYGPSEPLCKVIPAFLLSAAAGKPLIVKNGGEATYNFIYVDDLARCIVAARQAERSGIYNVASEESTTLLELARQIATLHADRKVEIKVEPLQSKPSCNGFPPMDIGKARTLLGLSPRRLIEGLIVYKDWLERRGFVP